MVMKLEQVPDDSFHCVGCGRIIPWDGKTPIAYTCPCGGTLFAGPKGYTLPASLFFGITGKGTKKLPHLDYYLGISDFVSAEKTKAIAELKKLGCVWSWECDKCKLETVELRWQQRHAKYIAFGIHPELKKLLDAYNPPIEKDLCDCCNIKPAEYTSSDSRFCKECAEHMKIVCSDTNKIKR